MDETAAPRQAKGWPLFAITLVVLLLAGFLVLKIRKKEVDPAFIKTEAGRRPQGPPERQGPGTAVDPLLEPYLKELRAAIEARRWDDARAALEAARKVHPDAAELKGVEDAIAEGRRRDLAEKAAAKLKAEQSRKMEQEWGLVKEKVEKDQNQNFWDSALKSLEEVATRFPDLRHDSGYESELRHVKALQTESDSYFKRDLAEARKLFSEGRYGQAYAQAESALAFYPERKDTVQSFQANVRGVWIQTSMVRIPSTPCWIGSDHSPEERPLRQVKLPAFLIDRYPVTNEDYYAFISSTRRPAPFHWGPARKPLSGQERHPVVFVTWEDARAYAQWAGKRLPTSDEWEVAARGPDKREYPWGNTFLEKEDTYPCNCLEYWQVHKSLAPGTTPVDAKEFDTGESAFGVFGMGGNVWEWTATASPPKGAKPPAEFRILRGGSFMTPKKTTRCAKVYAEDPRLPHPDVGFRCARDPQ